MIAQVEHFDRFNFIFFFIKARPLLELHVSFSLRLSHNKRTL